MIHTLEPSADSADAATRRRRLARRAWLAAAAIALAVGLVVGLVLGLSAEPPKPALFGYSLGSQSLRVPVGHEMYVDAGVHAEHGEMIHLETLSARVTVNTLGAKVHVYLCRSAGYGNGTLSDVCSHQGPVVPGDYRLRFGRQIIAVGVRPARPGQVVIAGFDVTYRRIGDPRLITQRVGLRTRFWTHASRRH